jgi:hypothetical protein
MCKKSLLCYNAGIMSFVKPALVPKHVIYGFFLLGLVSSVAFRAIIRRRLLAPAKKAPGMRETPMVPAGWELPL